MSVASAASARPIHCVSRPLHLHQVGTPPIGTGADPLSTMQWHLDHRYGAAMAALPFETDDRWLLGWLNSREHVAGLVQARPHGGHDYDDMPYYTIADGHQLTPADLALGLPQLTERAFAAHERLIGDDIPDQLQVSVPNALDLAYFVSGSIDAAAEWMPDMQAMVAGEVAEISARWGQRVRLQLESPAILLAYHNTQLQDWPLLTSEVVQQVVGILAAAPTADWVLHVCAALVEQTNIAAAVPFLNSVADLLAHLNQPMPVAHLPIVDGNVPPPTNPEFYAGLRHLRRGIDVIVGVVAESYPDQTHTAVGLVTDALGGPLAGVGAGCGLRDRSPAAGASNAALASSVARTWTTEPGR